MRRVDALPNERGLVFDRLMHDRVETMVGHHLEEADRELLARGERLVILGRPGIADAGRPLPHDLRVVGRRQHLLPGLEGRVSTTAEVLHERLIVTATSPFRQEIAQVADDDRIDNGRSRRLQLAESAVERPGHLREVLGIWLGGLAHRLAEDSDARSLETPCVEKRRVGGWDVADPEGSDRVLRVVAHHRIEQRRQVADGSGHGAERSIRARPAGVDAAPAHQASRRAHADDSVPGRGPADRRESLLPHPNRREVGRDGGPGTSG